MSRKNYNFLASSLKIAAAFSTVDANLPMASGNAEFLAAVRAFEDLVFSGFLYAWLQVFRVFLSAEAKVEEILVFFEAGAAVFGKHAQVGQDEEEEFCPDQNAASEEKVA